MKSKLPLLLLFLTVLSCTKEIGVTGPAGTQGPSGPAGAAGNSTSDTGTITGQLALYDEFSYPQSNAAGIVITLTGSSIQHTDTTNAAGQYSFPGMSTGTYNLSFQKTGYGTMKLFGLSHFGGGATPTDAQDLSLVQVPIKTAPNILSFTANTTGYTYFDLQLDTSSLQYEEYYQNLELFLGPNSNVSSTNYSWKATNPFYSDGIGGYLNIMIKGDQVNPPPFNAGDTVYAVAYTFNRFVHPTSAAGTDWYTDGVSSNTYIDPQTGLIVLPNLSKPSQILKFVF